MNGAAKAFNISYDLWVTRSKDEGRPVKAPPKTVIFSKDEQKLVDWLLELSKHGFGGASLLRQGGEGKSCKVSFRRTSLDPEMLGFKLQPSQSVAKSLNF